MIYSRSLTTIILDLTANSAFHYVEEDTAIPNTCPIGFQCLHQYQKPPQYKAHSILARNNYHVFPSISPTKAKRSHLSCTTDPPSTLTKNRAKAHNCFQSPYPPPPPQASQHPTNKPLPPSHRNSLTAANYCFTSNSSTPSSHSKHYISSHIFSHQPHPNKCATIHST